MYVSEKRSLQLVEIQDSVLPEDEWLIGISDMTYFRGVGFSMPLSSGEYHRLQGGPWLSPEDIGCSIELEPTSPDAESETEIMPGPALIEDSECRLIQSSASQRELGPELAAPDQLRPDQSMKLEIEPMNLYAFLPGLFYVSNERTSVDAVLIEVSQDEMFGTSLTSFRPEGVRTLHSNEGLTSGTRRNPSRSSAASPLPERPDTGIVSQQTGSTWGGMSRQTQQRSLSRAAEIDAALRLSRTMPLEELRQAYLFRTVIPIRLEALMGEIELEGVTPRHRIYIRNRKYPSGKVIEAKYRTLDNILQLNSETGLECPEDIDVSTELSELTFSSLGIVNREVSIEEAIIEISELMLSELGHESSRNKIIGLIS